MINGATTDGMIQNDLETVPNLNPFKKVPDCPKHELPGKARINRRLVIKNLTSRKKIEMERNTNSSDTFTSTPTLKFNVSVSANSEM